MRRAKFLDLGALNALPPEERSDWAEIVLERQAGLTPLKPPVRQPSLLSLRDPSLTPEQRMKIQDQLEKAAARKKRQLLLNLEKTLKAYGAQSAPGDDFDFTTHAPIKFQTAYDLARCHQEIKSAGAALHAARELTRDTIGSRDRMLAVWSHIWQRSDITDIGQPETLAYILNPVLLAGSANTAAATLKSLPVLHRVLSNNTVARQNLTRPEEVAYIVQQAAGDYEADELVQRLARQAASEILQSAANDHAPPPRPRGAARLSNLIVTAQQTAKIRARRSRRAAGLTLS